MVRWLKRGALALLLVILALALALWWLLRGSLPVLDGELALRGLSAPVTVTRDALGVVTIDAANQADAMRALGYVHAQARYFEMDLMRRSAAGELADLFGPIAVDLDKAHRIHRLRARAEARLDELPDAQRALGAAYVEGVNAGRRQLDVWPWPYLLLRHEPERWQPADSMLVGYAMYFDLQDAGNGRELALWRIKPHVPPALFELLSHDGSTWDAPIAGHARGAAPLPDAATLDLRELPAPTDEAVAALPPSQAPGSNNFAVAGMLTADGRAIVADDMHLGLRAPNVWFRARLRYPDPRAPGGRVDVTGFTLPGLPGVVVGSNGHVAWGFTNSYGDWLDWQWVPPCAEAPCPGVRTHRETIEVAGAPAQVLEVAETAWGPILHRNADGSALALRWSAHLPGSLNLGLNAFARAGSVEEVLELADHTALPAQNLVVGDSTGNIAWRLLGPVPQRGDGCIATPVGNDARLPDTAACEPWSLTTDTDLQLTDLAAGRVWTANGRVVDGAMLDRIGDGGYALGARARQIRDGLFVRQQFDEADLLAIQLDDRALFLQRWWQLLQRLSERQDSPALDRLATAAQDWGGHASPDSVSYRLVRAWREQVHERIAEGLTAPAQVALGDDFQMPRMPQLEAVAWPLVTQQPAHLLPKRYGSWAALFEDAAAQVDAELADPLAERTWGERNTAHICHPLADVLPGFLRSSLCMQPQPLPGDSHMPRVQGPDFGASERMVVAPGHEADGIAHMPGGQGGHPLSPFWGAGHEDWVEGRASPFLPGEAEHTLHLVPANPL